MGLKWNKIEGEYPLLPEYGELVLAAFEPPYGQYSTNLVDYGVALVRRSYQYKGVIVDGVQRTHRIEDWEQCGQEKEMRYGLNDVKYWAEVKPPRIASKDLKPKKEQENGK